MRIIDKKILTYRKMNDPTKKFPASGYAVLLESMHDVDVCKYCASTCVVKTKTRKLLTASRVVKAIPNDSSKHFHGRPR